MDQPNKPFDWNRARAFLATADTGSLSGAARVLGQTQPTLGRQVSALEEELGVVLFERVNRRMELTPSGRALVAHVRAMQDAADRVALAASGQSEEISGTVRITASDVFSVHVLPPMLRALRHKAPRLSIDVVAANDIRDLQRREADIAIRHVRPEQPELIARKVQDATAHFYAATRYLEQHGRPQTLSDLARLEFVSFGDPAQMITYLKEYGIEITAAQIPLNSENGIVAWELVRQGFGVAPMADAVGRSMPGVEALLPAMDPIVFPVWLTTHRELHTSRKIRLVFDLLADGFARI